jgi:hypothetical protein
MADLSVSFECWNCDKGCPTHADGKFVYIAMEISQDESHHAKAHPICGACADLVMDFTTDEDIMVRVLTYRQSPQGRLELIQ